MLHDFILPFFLSEPINELYIRKIFVLDICFETSSNVENSKRNSAVNFYIKFSLLYIVLESPKTIPNLVNKLRDVAKRLKSLKILDYELSA